MQVLAENNEPGLYTNSLVRRLAFDPCAVDPGYAVGFKRLSGVLEPHAVREVMAFHTWVPWTILWPLQCVPVCNTVAFGV